MDDENLLNADQVAMLLGVNRHWVRDHCTRALPIIPHNKLGRKVRFEREEIPRFIRECRGESPYVGTERKSGLILSFYAGFLLRMSTTFENCSTAFRCASGIVCI